MNKKVTWIRLFLLFLLGMFFTTYFGIKGFQKREKERNLIENILVNMYQVPMVLKQWYKQSFVKDIQEIELNGNSRSYPIGDVPEGMIVDESIYLLNYSYRGGNQGIVSMQNVSNGEVDYSWDIPLDTIMNDLLDIRRNLREAYFKDRIAIDLSTRVKKNFAAIQISAPIMLQDSSVVFHCGTLGYLYKIDKNSKIQWKSKRLTHHSIELDESGNIWSCSVDIGSNGKNNFRYRDDAILCLEPNGTERLFVSLTEVFEKAGLMDELIESSPIHELEFGQDPYHLNDILPIKKDGYLWERGDIVLSLRHKSLLLVYRPFNKKVIWYKQGPFLGQHDIDIVNDSILSVFNNNLSFLELDQTVGQSFSNIAYIDVKNNSVEFKLDSIFYSPYQGRQTKISDRLILVEETGNASYHYIDRLDKTDFVFYLPYFKEPSHAMNPTWARVYKKVGNKYILL